MRALLFGILLSISGSVFAQQRPIFDPDDFVDPGLHGGAAFVSTLIAGVAKNSIDDYRPLHEDAGFLQITNNLYLSNMQYTWKHSEVRTENDPPQVFACGCAEEIYFPTPALPNEIPEAPEAGSKDTLQIGWYRTVARVGGNPLVLRYRLTGTWQAIDTPVQSAATGRMFPSLSGHEKSLGIDADTHLRIRGRDVFGSLALARTVRTGTANNREQNEIVYTNRFAAIPFKQFLLRSAFAVGAVSNRGGTLINLVNPWFEIFWYERNTRANLHFVWSPQLTRDGGGWESDHQIAVFADYTLFVTLFGRE